MKKAIKYLAFALLILPCALLLVACGKVEGNTYKFDSVSSVSWAKEMTDEEKQKAYAETDDETIKTENDYFNFAKKTYNTYFKNIKMQFEQDGKVAIGEEKLETYYYVQDGNSIKIFDNEEKTGEAVYTATIKGKKIELQINLEDINATCIFKKA